MSLPSFSFNHLLGECSSGGQEKASQHLGEVPRAIGSAADIWQYENIEGRKNVRRFPSCNNKCYTFGSPSRAALQSLEGKGVMGPGEISTTF